MNKEDYFKYYIQGSEHYLIPKGVFDELFEEMENWREEAKELKKQIEEWKHHLKCSKEMLDIQGQKGNYDYNEYMLGLYNGMEYIIALFETREPIFKSGKDIEFISDKTQQKEFIEYLEDEIKNIKIKWGNKLTEKGYIDIAMTVRAYQIILQKYKEIIGGKE